MLKKINHVNIVVSNLDETKEFFIQLGLEIGDASELSGEWISSIVGLADVKARYATLYLPGTETNLELIEYSSPPSEKDLDMDKANQIGFRHIAFEVDDIDAEVLSLKDKGIKFLSSIHTYPKTGKRLVYFWGPDRILLELAQY
ncbi:glyoxalase/bleomycin resistance protein /dioxygenase [Candidatus Scalindua japonica]|uniref:Glyoxalase/bleomycin resistance protein /dioxygenase n=1 Tax=Candidatus Scalindua japonica TaxID=1284222 RepID=A0A286TUS6_9BACT|nr:VOC family protein [Candidatus Scalindua japonica]GAX59626.1 glyoxalase/bleomycin resistance protein /dioxygenase [Candidatus Scalindua japonica]